MHTHQIALLGGTGFVGRHLISRLARDGHRLKVLTRRREKHRDLLVIPTLRLIEADVHNPAHLRMHLAGCTAAINLVGILNEHGDDGRDFHHVHVELVEKLIAACRDLGVHRLLHMSALHASPAGPSHYLQSNGRAEELVQDAARHGLQVTSFRPSVIFGPGERFLNRFAQLLRWTPLFFPLACPQARFAPVCVTDVAEAMARCLDDPHSYGRRYDLCGPRTYTLHQLVAYTAQIIGVRRFIVPLPYFLSKLQASVLEYAPGKPFSRDNLRSLQVDSICVGGGALAALGIMPTPLEAVAPDYLLPSGQRRRYDDFRHRISLPA
ncbi:MAG TPA: complex I NDUFA9 subunit family protein [Gammaproteobacteria bacterium]|nr:complex I NDUFA9 subunit family protein [Gammaproteobacteria bacterium]